MRPLCLRRRLQANIARADHMTLTIIGLLLLLSLPDLMSPPISPTILRQTQTYSQTAHFVDGGFSLSALTIDVDGPRPFHIAYEFPLYQGVTGSLFVLFGPAVLWGKLVSLAATAAGLWIFLRLVREHWDERVATRAGALLASSPITLLMSTAFQPDALALALVGGALLALDRWRGAQALLPWLAFLLLLLAAAFAKFPVLVPFLPLVAMLVMRTGTRWRRLTLSETFAAMVIFVAPFMAWSLYRTTLMGSSSMLVDRNMFFIGDLSRFLRPSFYVKPAFILGAMAMCGVGVPLALAGLRRLERSAQALLCGLLLYYVLMPTAADQTYYALPLMPLLAILMAKGMVRLEAWSPRTVQTTVIAGWAAGFAVAAPYTLRHDNVSLAAAKAAKAASRSDDLLFVMNMHDRGVGIGGLNPTILTLASRRGWNVQFDTTEPDALGRQIETRHQEGLRWIVATWFTPDLDPWFTPLLPTDFSRRPKMNGLPVDGRAIVDRLATRYPVVTRGSNFAVMRLD
jgi:Dolichyl-phosphate-mannose-protein mannosyltransferase